LGDDFIGLAPYFLPTFTFPSVILRPIVPLWGFPWFDLWIGFTFGYHLWSTLREIRLNWSGTSFQLAGSGEWTKTDIAQRGFIYSGLFILTFGVAIHALLLAVLEMGYRGIPVCWEQFWITTKTVTISLTGCIVMVGNYVFEVLRKI